MKKVHALVESTMVRSERNKPFGFHRLFNR